MNPVILYTKKLELSFDQNGVSITDLDALIIEISKDYVIMDYSPSISIRDSFQYVTFRVIKKKETKTMGFDIGRKS